VSKPTALGRGWRLVDTTPVRRVVRWVPYLLFLLPLLFFSDQIDVWVNPLLIAIAGAVALNMLTGTAGLVSLGQSAFLAVGAYTSVAISITAGLPFWVALISSLLSGAVIGVIVAVTTSRLRGLYGVLSTLALQYVVVYVGTQYEQSANNTAAFVLPPAKLFVSITSNTSWYVVLAVTAFLCLEIYRRLLCSHVGRAWEVIRERDRTAAMLGIDVRRYEMYAWLTSGAMVAVVGCLQAYYLSAVSPDFFTLNVAIQFFAMIVIGGRGSPIGSVIGAVVLITIPYEMQAIVSRVGSSNAVSALSDYEQIVYGALLVLFLFLAPDGLAGRIGALCRQLWAKFVVPRLTTAPSLAGADRPTPPAVLVPTPVSPGSPQPVPGRPGMRGIPKAEPTTATGFLEITDLTVSYKSAGLALENVSMSMSQGEVVAILGPNGVGKTTLLRAISGFAPDEPGTINRGTVQFRGARLNRVKPHLRARRGIVLVPERDKVFPQLTVYENLELACPRGKSVSDAADEVVSLFPALRPRLRTAGGLLSGGERQMLAIARAFMLEPALLLLDETSLGLAPIVASQVMDEIRAVVRENKISVLLVEQNIGLAKVVADRYYILQQGRIAAAGEFGENDDVEELSGSYFGEVAT
jgi:ABC-type branched-subunit amino acid transport system ATPase component/ABC-type branched-subunit amino acid transport system permease subunit